MLRLLAAALMLLSCALPAMAAGEPHDRVIRGIVIEGLKRTVPRTVLRELPFRQGDVWQASYAAESERRLRNLGLFSSVVVTPPDAKGLVHIGVDERWPIWLLPEASRHDNGSTSAGGTYTDYNLWGLRHTLRLAYRHDTGKNFGGSGPAGHSYNASYDWYRIDDSMWSMSVYGTRGRQVFDAYSNGVVQSEYLNDVSSEGVRLNYSFGPVPTQGTTASIGFDSAVTSYQLLTGPAQPDVQGQHRHSVTLSINSQWLDNQITWLKGWRMGYSINVSNKIFGSSIQAIRQSAYIRDYYDLSGQKTLNFRLDGGVATGDVLRNGLYDIGGGQGVRGYIPGELQGSAYLEGSIESRIPVWHASNLIWVAFTDFGYLARKAQQITNIHPFVVGTGTGLRLTLRWLMHGTIRGDAAYGWATHRWRFYFGTGQAF